MSTIFHPREHEDPRPQRGALPAIASPAPHETNAASQSLNGTWRFRYTETVEAPDGEGDAFADPGYSDKKWASMPVPAHWVLNGYGAPQYQNIKYPFPVDAPYVPDQNPTGWYRYSFTPKWDAHKERGMVSWPIHLKLMGRPYCGLTASRAGTRSGSTGSSSEAARVPGCQPSST